MLMYNNIDRKRGGGGTTYLSGWIRIQAPIMAPATLFEPSTHIRIFQKGIKVFRHGQKSLFLLVSNMMQR